MGVGFYIGWSGKMSLGKSGVRGGPVWVSRSQGAASWDVRGSSGLTRCVCPMSHPFLSLLYLGGPGGRDRGGWDLGLGSSHSTLPVPSTCSSPNGDPGMAVPLATPTLQVSATLGPFGCLHPLAFQPSAPSQGDPRPVHVAPIPAGESQDGFCKPGVFPLPEKLHSALSTPS